MDMYKKKRWVFALVACLSVVAVGFLSAALATDYWVAANPIRSVDNATQNEAKDVNDGKIGTKFRGSIHFGLFRGYKSLDHGLGVREGEIWIIEEGGDVGKFSFGLWISTVIFVALGIALGLVAMAFAVLNAATRPIETITGPMGLYIWNSMAMLSSLTGLILYVVLYFQDFKLNVLSQEDIIAYRWTSENRANLSFSFYFVLIATVFYAVNVLVIALSGIQCHPIRYKDNITPKSLDGVMMY